MSGADLLSTLKSLGFPGSETLDSQALDWMFEEQEVAPMLHWFCQSLSAANVLTAKQLDDYKSLTQSGGVVLKGRQLEEALSSLDYSCDKEISEEQLKQEVEQLENSLSHYQKQKTRLAKRRNQLSNHQMNMSHRLSKLSQVKGKVEQEYKTALSQAHTHNTQLNDSIDKICKSVGSLSALYKEPAPNKSGDASTSFNITLSGLPLKSSVSGKPNSLPCQTASPAMFFSQIPVLQYYSAEESYTSQLTAFTKKQFFQGIAEMASCGEDSRFEILEVSDPDSLLVRGESNEVNIQDCKELARLQKLFVKSESDRIKATCEMQRLKGQLESAKGVLSALDSGTFCTEGLKNKERLDKLRASQKSVQQEFSALGEGDFPTLIQECREAKVIRVLTGDYNLKLARQDYFTANQDKVITQLIVQRSRNEFVTMALELELRQHREIHHLLTSLFSQLQNHLTQFEARLHVMADTSLTPARHKRETIDSRDKSTARLYHMLDDSVEAAGGRQLFLTHNSLVENAGQLQQRHSQLHRSLEFTSSASMDHIHMLEASVRECESLLYAESSTSSGPPPLTPRPIQQAMISLREMLARLEQNILDLVKDIDHKKKVLKADPLLTRERKLFIYFFNNPAKLHQTFEEISSRLQATARMEKS